jgi:ribosomal protein S18 acetylase RimI-like enzyme
MTPANIVVRPIRHADVGGFRACVNAVARERKYLAFLEPFPIEQMTAFVACNIEHGNPHFVAEDAGRIVGWCDVRREAAHSYAHVGHLGMGLLPEYRGRGLGERLIRAALDASPGARFERVELSVYATNARARALYEKVGFVLERTRVRGRKVDGVYDDVHIMGWFPR